MNTEAIDLRSAVVSVRAMLDGLAHASGVELRITFHDQPPLAVRADARRLRQVLSNLLSNGIKYNHRGGWVQVGALRQGDTVELSVADSGIGLADEQIARLFNPFERLGAENSGVQGSGLGLALTRELVQAMGGSVGVHSRQGEGSTFFVRLPAA